MVQIRSYAPADGKVLLELFHHTVHTATGGLYSPEELNAWAPGNYDMNYWNLRLQDNYTLVAVSGDRITGFGNLASRAGIDMLYVHPDYQRNGTGSALLNALEAQLLGFNRKVVTLEASRNARPFFERRGYTFVRENVKDRNGVKIVNYLLEKRLL